MKRKGDNKWTYRTFSCTMGQTTWTVFFTTLLCTFVNRAALSGPSQIPPFPKELNRTAFHRFFSSDGLYWAKWISDEFTVPIKCFCIIVRRDKPEAGCYQFSISAPINQTYTFSQQLQGCTLHGQDEYHTLGLTKETPADTQKRMVQSAEQTFAKAYVTYVGTGRLCSVVYMYNSDEDRQGGWCGWLIKDRSESPDDCNRYFTSCLTKINPRGVGTYISNNECGDTCVKGR